MAAQMQTATTAHAAAMVPMSHHHHCFISFRVSWFSLMSSSHLVSNDCSSFSDFSVRERVTPFP